jgi:hypothetical protein
VPENELQELLGMYTIKRIVDYAAAARSTSPQLSPLFIEGRTPAGKCEYWCKECLANKK